MTFDGAMYEIGLPLGTGAAIDQSPPIPKVLGALGLRDPAEVLNSGSVFGGKYFFAEVTPAAFAGLTPDISTIREMTQGMYGFLVTAAGMPSPHAACPTPDTVDFSVRNFIPQLGCDEDVATGSIQAFLNPYWTAKP